MRLLLEKLEEEYANRIKIGRLNIDMYPSIASKYMISGTPTFLIFKERKVVSSGIGAKSESQLREMIEPTLKD